MPTEEPAYLREAHAFDEALFARVANSDRPCGDLLAGEKARSEYDEESKRVRDLRRMRRLIHPKCHNRQAEILQASWISET